MMKNFLGKVLGISLWSLFFLFQVSPLTSAPPSDENASIEDDDYNNDQVDEMDPLEPINRIIFAFNQMLDGLVLRPVSLVYREVVPEPWRDSVKTCISNLLTPVTVVNYVLQGDPTKAGTSLMRFCINSTVGVAGLVDVADTFDLHPTDTGFDETLATWGFGAGPYIVLPALGPSTLRGTTGIVADYFADPINYYYTHKGKKHKWVLYTDTSLRFIDKRHRVIDVIDQLQKDSLDFYATMRSIHFQQLNHKRDQLLDKKRHDLVIKN